MNAPPSPDEASTSALGEVVTRLARRIRPEAIGIGGVARLRRLDPAAPDAPEFWRLVAEVGAPEGSERGWALVMAGMARMAPNHHRRGEEHAPGRVLAATGYAEARLLRLLRADPDSPAFADSFRAATRWLALKGRAVDWCGFAALALALQEGSIKTARRRIARDYYAGHDHARNDDQEDAPRP